MCRTQIEQTNTKVLSPHNQHHLIFFCQNTEPCLTSGILKIYLENNHNFSQKNVKSRMVKWMRLALPSSNRSAIAKSKNHRFVVHVTKNEKGDEHRSRTRVNIQMFWHYQSLFSLCAFERHRSVVLVRVSLCGVFFCCVSAGRVIL